MGTAARGRAFAVGLAMACTLGAAGCSADPDDQPTEATPSSPTPTNDQTDPPVNQVTEPTLPAAAEGSSIRSAKAFVGYYIDLLNYAMVTGDTKAFRAAARNCEGCDRYADLFDRIEEAGGSAQTRGWEVEEVAAARQGNATAVVFDVDAAAVKSKPRANAEPTHIPPAKFELRLLLAPVGSSWRAVEFTRS